MFHTLQQLFITLINFMSYLHLLALTCNDSDCMSKNFVVEPVYLAELMHQELSLVLI